MKHLYKYVFLGALFLGSSDAYSIGLSDILRQHRAKAYSVSALVLPGFAYKLYSIGYSKTALAVLTLGAILGIKTYCAPTVSFYDNQDLVDSLDGLARIEYKTQDSLERRFIQLFKFYYSEYQSNKKVNAILNEYVESLLKVQEKYGFEGQEPWRVLNCRTGAETELYNLKKDTKERLAKV